MKYIFTFLIFIGLSSSAVGGVGDVYYCDTKMVVTVYENEMPKKYYWDYKNQQKIFELGEKVLNLVSGTRRGGAI